MSQVSSNGAASSAKLHWTQDPKNKARLRKLRKASNAKIAAARKKGKEVLLRNGVSLHVHRLANKVQKGVISAMQEHGATDFLTDVLLLTQEVLRG